MSIGDGERFDVVGMRSDLRVTRDVDNSGPILVASEPKEWRTEGAYGRPATF